MGRKFPNVGTTSQKQKPKQRICGKGASKTSE